MINYERTGKIRKGAAPKWFNIIHTHVSNIDPNQRIASNTYTTSVLPISHKRNKLEWIFDFSRYDEISFGKLVHKNNTKSDAYGFYEHWIPSPLQASNEHQNKLVKCNGCNLGVKTTNFKHKLSSQTISCVVKCRLSFLGRIDHVKRTMGNQGLAIATLPTHF